MTVHISFSRIALFLLLALSFVLTCCGTPTPQHQVRAAEVHQTTQRSNGCGKAIVVQPGTSSNQHVLVNSVRRSYRLHVPVGYQNNNATSLVLNFHGFSSNALQQEKRTGLSQLADQENFMVAYPQGTLTPGGKAGWNTGPANRPHANDLLFVRYMLTQVESQYCVNTQRIYASGFSNGGGFTNVLACQMSDTFAAFGIVSGGMHPVPGGCHPSRPVSLLEIHGTGDHTDFYHGNPYYDEEPGIPLWLAQWAALDKCNKTPDAFIQQKALFAERWNGCNQNAEIVHYRITGSGHVWPHTVIAATTSDHSVDASQILWQFFQQHTLS